MRFETKEIEGYKYVTAIYDYNDDEEIIEELIQKAKSLSVKVNPKSSGGIYRSEETRVNKLLGGLLVEYSFLTLMKRLTKKHSVGFDVIDSSFSQDSDLEAMGFNQIDINMLLRDRRIEVEVRSSFSYKTSFERLLGFPLINKKSAFSLIAWYITENKPKEFVKDIYVFGILYHHPKEMMDRAKQLSVVNIVAIASKETIRKHGYTDNLKQKGALFTVINPINAIDDVVIVLRNLLEV